MEGRILSTPEVHVLRQALDYQARRIREELSEAATDNKLESIRRLYAALFLCDDLRRSVSNGLFRVVGS